MNASRVPRSSEYLLDVMQLIRRLAMTGVGAGRPDDLQAIERWMEGVDPAAGVEIMDCLEQVTVALDVVEGFLSGDSTPRELRMPRDAKERRARLAQITRKFIDKARRRSAQGRNAPRLAWSTGQALALIETAISAAGFDSQAGTEAVAARIRMWNTDERMDVLAAAENIEYVLAFVADFVVPGGIAE